LKVLALVHEQMVEAARRLLSLLAASALPSRSSPHLLPQLFANLWAFPRR
jgi:hypothetical protein